MNRRHVNATIAAIAMISTSVACADSTDAGSVWQKDFDMAKCTMKTQGRNEYFVLEPGFQKTLEGGGERLQVTVLKETRELAGVVTRVVEEREWSDGKLKEVARNYFALCEQTGDVYYFGEDVDFYENGKIINHDGTWHAGENGNKPGLIMPGAVRPKMKYYQEIAPGVAMDRAEIISISETCKTPAGTFARCMKVKEDSAIEPLVFEYKYHAPGIGLIRDKDLRLVRHGVVKAD